MRLYLSQHGEAEQESLNPDRPLTAKGKRDVERLAAFAAQGGFCQPEVIYHSGKTRARETADIFGEALKPGHGIVQAEHLSPKDDPVLWRVKAESFTGDAMVVGHLPHLARLASLLLCDDPERSIVEFRNGCILCLEQKEGFSWSVQWLLLPSILTSFPFSRHSRESGDPAIETT